MRAVIPAVLISALLFTGCVSDSPKPGGEYVLSLASNPENLDPQVATDVSSFNIIRNIYATLVDIDDSGFIVPGAAKKYEVSEDGLLYTFILRDDLIWKKKGSKNNPSLTADDYIYAVRRIYDDNTHSPYKYLFSGIENINAIDKGSAGIYAKDKYTLCIKLSSPDCDFLKKLAHPAASPCNEQLFLSTEGRYGLSVDDTYSCGAFFVSDWNYDPYWNENHITLTRINANSSSDYVTYPDSIDFLIGRDEETAMSVVDGKAHTGGDTVGKAVREYSCGTSVLIFSPESVFAEEKLRNAAFSSIASALSEKDNDLPASYIPPHVTLGGKNFSEIGKPVYPKMSREESKQVFDEYISSEKFDHQVILAGDDFSRPELCYDVSSILEGLDYFSAVEFCEKDELLRRYEENDYDICVYNVLPEINSADSFFERLFGVSGYNGTDRLMYLSAIKDISDKAGFALQLEQAFYQAGYAYPICHESVSVMYDEDLYDFWYEPYTQTFFLKYMKQK